MANQHRTLDSCLYSLRETRCAGRKDFAFGEAADRPVLIGLQNPTNVGAQHVQDADSTRCSQGGSTDRTRRSWLPIHAHLNARPSVTHFATGLRSSLRSNCFRSVPYFGTSYLLYRFRARLCSAVVSGDERNHAPLSADAESGLLISRETAPHRNGQESGTIASRAFRPLPAVAVATRTG